MVHMILSLNAFILIESSQLSSSIISCYLLSYPTLSYPILSYHTLGVIDMGGGVDISVAVATPNGLITPIVTGETRDIHTHLNPHLIISVINFI